MCCVRRESQRLATKSTRSSEARVAHKFDTIEELDLSIEPQLTLEVPFLRTSTPTEKEVLFMRRMEFARGEFALYRPSDWNIKGEQSLETCKKKCIEARTL